MCAKLGKDSGSSWRFCAARGICINQARRCAHFAEGIRQPIASTTSELQTRNASISADLSSTVGTRTAARSR